jgi:hypothetical protein
MIEGISVNKGLGVSFFLLVAQFACCSICENECANLKFGPFCFTKIDCMTNSTKNGLRQKCHAFRHIWVDLLYLRGGSISTKGLSVLPHVFNAVVFELHGSCQRSK